MPGANEVSGCPPTKKIFLPTNSCRKFLTSFFYSHFSQFLLFLSQHLSGCPPYPGCPGSFVTFYAFTLTFRHLPMHFFRKLHRWMPPGGCSGPSHPPHPPLHATALHLRSQTCSRSRCRHPNTV